MKRAPRLCSALILFATASWASAQGSAGLHFGVAGGATFPIEATGDVFDTGYHGSLMLIFNLPAAPIGFRFEGSYARMNEVNGRLEIGAGTANLVLCPRLLLLKPYFFGGAGAYRLKFTHAAGRVDFEDTQSKFGFNVGGGIAFPIGPGASMFIEARYTRVDSDPNSVVGSHLTYVPVTVGIVF